MKISLILGVTCLALLTPTRMHAQAHYPSGATSEEPHGGDVFAAGIEIVSL